MGLDVKPGARYRSAVCDTQVAVVQAADPTIDLQCGGQPMLAMDDESAHDSTPAAGFDEGSLVGKRYVNADETIEVLCTKPGAGSLSVGADRLDLKDAKPLPSSD